MNEEQTEQTKFNNWLSSQNPYLVSRKKLSSIDYYTSRDIWKGAVNLRIPFEMMSNLNIEELLTMYSCVEDAKTLINQDSSLTELFKEPKNIIDAVQFLQSHNFENKNGQGSHNGYSKIRKNKIEFPTIYSIKKGSQKERIDSLPLLVKQEFVNQVLKPYERTANHLDYHEKSFFLNTIYQNLSIQWKTISKNVEYKPELFSEDFLKKYQHRK